MPLGQVVEINRALGLPAGDDADDHPLEDEGIIQNPVLVPAILRIRLGHGHLQVFPPGPVNLPGQNVLEDFLVGVLDPEGQIIPRVVAIDPEPEPLRRVGQREVAVDFDVAQAVLALFGTSTDTTTRLASTAGGRQMNGSALPAAGTRSA